MQIKKVVSGGQTGVDRAALDVALELGLPCGGWCPKGRLAEDGVIPERYPLKETPSADYPERTEWNVRDSDGTLVLTSGKPSGGTTLTIALARRYHKPCLLIDLLATKPGLERVPGWVSANNISTLNVAGPRESKALGTYKRAAMTLRRLLQKA